LSNTKKPAYSADFPSFLFRDFLLQFYSLVKIVLRTDLVASGKAASLAPVRDDPFVPAVIQVIRPHHAAANSSAIARIIIDVLGPQALRTMIGKPIAPNLCPAMLAGKILDFLYKSHNIILF